ncbi:MAG: GNAT family N-acetyltransferase [Anaerolineaceae bacterium]|nr:GNAT family N-acetyltransferase [Anaerolineaceae bacterium]
MSSIAIHSLDSAYRAWAETFITQHWGSLRQVSRGKLYDVLDYPGLVGLADGQPVGIVIYHVEGEACEILLLHSAAEGQGVGSALVDAVKERAVGAGCSRLWLITTNDNLHAIRWYQRRGFTIAAVHVNALAESRKLKPEIPLIGFEGIPLRDEIEFEIRLTLSPV